MLMLWLPNTQSTLKFLSVLSHEILTMEDVHPLLTTELSSNLLHPRLQWVYSFVVVLSLCASLDIWTIRTICSHCFCHRGTQSSRQAENVVSNGEAWNGDPDPEECSIYFYNVLFMFITPELWMLDSAPALRCSGHNNLSEAVAHPARVLHQVPTRGFDVTLLCPVRPLPITHPQLVAPECTRTRALSSKPAAPDGKFQERPWRHKPYHSEETTGARRGAGPSSEKCFSSCRFSYVAVVLWWCPFGAVAGGFGEPVAGRVSAVVAVVVGPAWRRGGIGLVVVFAERCGVVGGRVDVGLLERRRVEVGSFIWQQVVLVQRLEWQQREIWRIQLPALTAYWIFLKNKELLSVLHKHCFWSLIQFFKFFLTESFNILTNMLLPPWGYQVTSTHYRKSLLQAKK